MNGKTMFAARAGQASATRPAIAAIVSFTLLFAHAAGAQGTGACTASGPDSPMMVTADCVDPQFDRPIIDSETDVAAPLAMHKVAGHFDGTDVKFTFYLPEKKQWNGRFFHQVYPLGDGTASNETLGFGAESGAYTVQTVSPSGYRGNAAAAKFSRTIARKYYGTGSKRIYGYIYGGSGGSYQTIAAVENSVGVWDGAVPYVVGVPTSIPNNFFVRAFARLVLKDKAGGMADAVRPGGSGAPFADLDQTQRAVLEEVTAMGVPLRGWDNASYVLGLNDPQGLLSFGETVRGIDPTYADDFWSKPGYLGTEKSALGDLVRKAKVDQAVTIGQVDRDGEGAPTGFVVKDARAIRADMLLDFTVRDSTGTIGRVAGTFDPSKGRFSIAPKNSPAVLAAIVDDATLRVDNRWSVALTSYHRHQIPAEPGFTAWDQFRKSDGTPRYPQREKEVGPSISRSVSGGGSHNGMVHGKVIVVGNLLDVDAFPWHVDWYAQRVKAALGKNYGASVRVWLNDSADHLDGSVQASGAVDSQWVRLIDYNGILQQAVRDVSAWVETGTAPPLSTRYEVKNQQITVPLLASDRRGVQPTIQLAAGGRTNVEVPVGGRVELVGSIQVPPGAGKVVAIEWNQTGRGDFAAASVPAGSGSTMTVRTSFTYTKPGIYYPVLQVTSQRGNAASYQFGRVKNLARMRVIVR